MPNKAEVMESASEGLIARQASRNPQPIKSAIVVGVCFVITGALATALNWSSDALEHPFLEAVGMMFLMLGVPLIILGLRGTARHRVTETTRYPQQTGEIHDMLFQILGEDYLWIQVALMIIFVFLIAWTLKGG